MNSFTLTVCRLPAPLEAKIYLITKRTRDKHLAHCFHGKCSSTFHSITIRIQCFIRFALFAYRFHFIVRFNFFFGLKICNELYGIVVPLRLMQHQEPEMNEPCCSCVAARDKKNAMSCRQKLKSPEPDALAAPFTQAESRQIK